MTLIIETGNGIRNANSYVNVAYITAYLTDRGRETESSWDSIGVPAQEAAAIKAADYIEKRFSTKFIGAPEFASLVGLAAIGSIAFTGQPSAGEVIVLGGKTYTFQVAIGDNSDNEILIGVDLATSIANLAAAINESGTAGTEYSENVQASRSATAVEAATSIELTSCEIGDSGNQTTLSTDVTGATATAFALGVDAGPQPLSYPRTGSISGIPTSLKQAQSEYAIRAAAATLMADPAAGGNPSGDVIGLKQKVGSLEIDTKYSDRASSRSAGTSLVSDSLIPEYPAADLLLQPLIGASNTFGRYARA